MCQHNIISLHCCLLDTSDYVCVLTTFPGIFPTKTIRVLSLAPNLTTILSSEDDETSAPSGANEEAHAAILEIMDMLSDDDSSESGNEAAETTVTAL